MDRLERIRHIEIMDDEHAAIVRSIPGSCRVAMMDELCEFGRSLMRARIRTAHPSWTEEELNHEVARRIAIASE